MAQSNEQGGDVPTGLDEAVRMFAGYVRGENGFDELDFKEWLIEWHNKQIEKTVSADEFLNYLFRNGYVDREWDAEELEAERSRLRGETK